MALVGRPCGADNGNCVVGELVSCYHTDAVVSTELMVQYSFKTFNQQSTFHRIIKKIYSII